MRSGRVTSMTLTLADIEVWDYAAIDQVFAAAMARAEGAQTAGNTVGDLLSFIQWDGRAADAARDSAHRIKVTLNDHGDQCRRVADAAKKASAEVADLKYRLSKIRADADEAFIAIDYQTGALTPKTAVLTVSQLQHQKAQEVVGQPDPAAAGGLHRPGPRRDRPRRDSGRYP